MNRVFSVLGKLSGNPNISSMNGYFQHGDTPCLLHTVAVAYYSLILAEKLHIRVHKRALLKGALLHDYYLYDWHKKNHGHKVHGFTHPCTAMNNAERDFGLNHIERDVIRKHMFPLTLKPPVTREAWLVCCVDKWCACRETFGRHIYGKLRDEMQKHSSIDYR